MVNPQTTIPRLDGRIPRDIRPDGRAAAPALAGPGRRPEKLFWPPVARGRA